MTPPTPSRAERIAILRDHFARTPTDPSRWKDAVALLEQMAPEGAVVPDLIALYGLLDLHDRFMAVSLLGETRHPDAWPRLSRMLYHPGCDPSLGGWVSRAVAMTGGDAGHASLLQRLREPTDPAVLPRVLDAIRSFDRAEGALALRGAFDRGTVSLVDAAVRIAPMSLPLSTIVAWWDEATPGGRALALEIAITRAGPIVHRPLPAACHGWVTAMLATPPREISRLDRARLERWIAAG